MGASVYIVRMWPFVYVKQIGYFGRAIPSERLRSASSALADVEATQATFVWAVTPGCPLRIFSYVTRLLKRRLRGSQNEIGFYFHRKKETRSKLIQLQMKANSHQILVRWPNSRTEKTCCFVHIYSPVVKEHWNANDTIVYTVMRYIWINRAIMNMDDFLIRTILILITTAFLRIL